LQRLERRQLHLTVVGDRQHLVLPLVRPGEEFLDHPQIVHQLDGGGVHGVAPEIAQKVAVFLQHNDGDARAREHPAEHRTGWAASGDHTTRFARFTGPHLTSWGRRARPVSERVTDRTYSPSNTRIAASATMLA